MAESKAVQLCTLTWRDLLLSPAPPNRKPSIWRWRFGNVIVLFFIFPPRVVWQRSAVQQTGVYREEAHLFSWLLPLSSCSGDGCFSVLIPLHPASFYPAVKSSAARVSEMHFHFFFSFKLHAHLSGYCNFRTVPLFTLFFLLAFAAITLV